MSDGLAIVVGASQGLGLDVARSLHGDGRHVVTLSRNAPAEAPPWEHELADASDPAQVDAFFARWGDRLGDHNMLVNFAGARYNVSIADSDPRAWRDCVDSSLYTAYLMTRGFARASAGRPGAIVNMSSIHATAAAAGRSAYAAAKAAIEQLTAISAIELAPQGIRVNCVAPGFIRTEASARMIASGALDGASIERRTPLRRLGEPAEITDVVRFLLSEESRFISGETIRADGGWLRHAEV